MKPKVLLKRLLHHEKWRIALFFDFDQNLKSKVKSIPGANYSATHRCFYFDDSEENLKLILKTIRDFADIDITLMTKKNGDAEKNVNPKEEGASTKAPPDNKPVEDENTEPFKIYYKITGKRKVDPDFLERPCRRRTLPKVFSKEEVSNILNSSGNLKHKLLLWIIYSCGLRRSEVTNIRLTDLDRERNILHIREGKGLVDRFVPVPNKVWVKVDEYTSAYKPREYLFEGQTGGRYSSESVYRVFKEALVKTGIKKDVGVHSLRHSYATHLHENGLDIRYIQELLGHKSTRTTEIYTHVSRRNLIAVRSPIDDLDVK